MKKLLFICLLPLFAFISCETMPGFAPRTGAGNTGTVWILGNFSDAEGNRTGYRFIRWPATPAPREIRGTYVMPGRNGAFRIEHLDFSETDGLAFTLLNEIVVGQALVGPHLVTRYEVATIPPHSRVDVRLNQVYTFRADFRNGRVVVPFNEDLFRVLSLEREINFEVSFLLATAQFVVYRFNFTPSEFTRAFAFMTNL